MKLPANKFTLFAAAWFAAGIYALIFRESGNAPPPFPHFDKAAHFALFFAQIWLLAKAFIHDGLKIPYRGLLAFALLFAAGSEWAQAAFTVTREGSVGDGIADMLGASAALWLAAKTAAVKNILKGRLKSCFRWPFYVFKQGCIRICF